LQLHGPLHWQHNGTTTPLCLNRRGLFSVFGPTWTEASAAIIGRLIDYFPVETALRKIVEAIEQGKPDPRRAA
jgi:hypothetical protein